MSTSRVSSCTPFCSASTVGVTVFPGFEEPIYTSFTTTAPSPPYHHHEVEVDPALLLQTLRCFRGFPELYEHACVHVQNVVTQMDDSNKEIKHLDTLLPSLSVAVYADLLKCFHELFPHHNCLTQDGTRFETARVFDCPLLALFRHSQAAVCGFVLKHNSPGRLLDTGLADSWCGIEGAFKTWRVVLQAHLSYAVSLADIRLLKHRFTTTTVVHFEHSRPGVPWSASDIVTVRLYDREHWTSLSAYAYGPKARSHQRAAMNGLVPPVLISLPKAKKGGHAQTKYFEEALNKAGIVCTSALGGWFSDCPLPAAFSKRKNQPSVENDHHHKNLCLKANECQRVLWCFEKARHKTAHAHIRHFVQALDRLSAEHCLTKCAYETFVRIYAPNVPPSFESDGQACELQNDGAPPTVEQQTETEICQDLAGI